MGLHYLRMWVLSLYLSSNICTVCVCVCKIKPCDVCVCGWVYPWCKLLGWRKTHWPDNELYTVHVPQSVNLSVRVQILEKGQYYTSEVRERVPLLCLPKGEAVVSLQCVKMPHKVAQYQDFSVWKAVQLYVPHWLSHQLFTALWLTASTCIASRK